MYFMSKLSKTLNFLGTLQKKSALSTLGFMLTTVDFFGARETVKLRQLLLGTLLKSILIGIGSLCLIHGQRIAFGHLTTVT